MGFQSMDYQMVVMMDATALAFPRSMLKFKSLLITPHLWKSGR